MNQRPRSRKKNIVNGTVSQIKRQGQGLGLPSVGNRVDVITKIIKRRKETE